MTDAVLRLSDLDHEIVGEVSWLRVVTQTQLERLHPDVPARSLRYRTQRLRRLGLLGATRPYRDQGSAPNHLWPTTRGDTLARGAPPPRRGGRRTPNPLFLAHSAAITELYVVLKTRAPDHGLRLKDFLREGSARHPFKDIAGAERAIAPDVLFQLVEEDGKGLLGHVEIDLGTMSHARLRTKLQSYLAYAERPVEKSGLPFLPVLLFITTSQQRADTFLRTARKLAASKRWAGRLGDWQLAVCAHARHLDRALTEPAWSTLDDNGLTLHACLERARAPFLEARAARKAARAEAERHRERLLDDPVELRGYLRDERALRRLLDESLDDTEQVALDLLLSGDAPLDKPERNALRTLVVQLADLIPLGVLPLDFKLDPPDLDALAHHYRQSQLREVDDLIARIGPVPHLRRTRADLTNGRLMHRHSLDWLPTEAERDIEKAKAQNEQRLAYLEFRDSEARLLAREQGIAGRLRHGPETFHTEIDERWLRVCTRCGETAYPRKPSLPYAKPDPAHECHYCGPSGSIERWRSRDPEPVP